jgi:hypothetical protein
VVPRGSLQRLVLPLSVEPRRQEQPASRRRSTLRAGALPPPLSLELGLAPVEALAGAGLSDSGSFHDMLQLWMPFCGQGEPSFDAPCATIDISTCFVAA